MEIMLPLPINNFSSIPAGGAQAPAATSPGGNFLKVLAQYFGKKAAGKMVSEEQGLENLDSSTLANLLGALAVGNPSFVALQMGPSSGNGLSELKEDPASVANALLEVYAQGENLPGVPRETFASLQSPNSSGANGAFFASPLPSGEEKQGEPAAGAVGLGNFMPSSNSSGVNGAFFASPLSSGEEKQGEPAAGAVGLGNFMPSSNSSRANGAFLTSPLPSGKEKRGELPVGADGFGNFMPSSNSSGANGTFFASPLPRGEEKQGEQTAGADGLRNFISSPVPSGKEGQTGQPEWVDPPQNPAVKVKPPEKEGSFLSEGKLERPYPERVSIPPREMGSATTGDTGQGKIEPFDPSSQKKEIASHPPSKERVKGESFLAIGGAEIKPIADPAHSPKQESPFLSRQERFSEAEPPSFIRKESTQTMVSDKHSVGEENPALSHPPQPSTFQNMGEEVLSRSHEEKDGLQVLGIRNGQTHPSGKENQTFLGSYGASSQPTAPSFGFAEKVTEGKEALAPMRSEPQSVNQQVGERVLWLIRNQEEKIKVTLDPPELGHLCLEIHRTKENIQATLLTDNPLTKATLESSQGEIQKIIENEGFKLEKFDVLVQQDLSRFQERKESQWHSDSRNSSAPGKMEIPGSAPLDSLSRVPHRMNSGNQYLDLFV